MNTTESMLNEDDKNLEVFLTQDEDNAAVWSITP